MTNLLAGLIDFLINFIGDVIPAYNFELETYNNISGSITSVVSFLTDVNFIIPLGDIATIIILSLGLKLFKFGLFCGNWIVRRVCDVLP